MEYDAKGPTIKSHSKRGERDPVLPLQHHLSKKLCVHVTCFMNRKESITIDSSILVSFLILT